MKPRARADAEDRREMILGRRRRATARPGPLLDTADLEAPEPRLSAEPRTEPARFEEVPAPLGRGSPERVVEPCGADLSVARRVRHLFTGLPCQGTDCAD